jgi:hypothetical protein
MRSTLLLPWRIRLCGLFPFRINSEVWILYTGLLGRGISPSKGRYLHRITHTRGKTQTDVHVSSGIRTHDPRVWAGEDISCCTKSGHCDRYVRCLGFHNGIPKEHMENPSEHGNIFTSFSLVVTCSSLRVSGPARGFNSQKLNYFKIEEYQLPGYNAV